MTHADQERHRRHGLGRVRRPTSGSRRQGSSALARARDARSGPTRPPTRRSTPSGKYVIPGGIDVPHAHGYAVRRHQLASDDFETGTIAAAWGGTTTIVDFAVQTQGRLDAGGLDTWLAKAAGNGRGRLRLPHDHDGGVDAARRSRTWPRWSTRASRRFKLFMAYPGVFYSSTISRSSAAMLRAGELGAMIMMHAENGPPIDVLVQQALAAWPHRARLPQR